MGTSSLARPFSMIRRSRLVPSREKWASPVPRWAGPASVEPRVAGDHMGFERDAALEGGFQKARSELPGRR